MVQFIPLDGSETKEIDFGIPVGNLRVSADGKLAFVKANRVGPGLPSPLDDPKEIWVMENFIPVAKAVK